MSKNLRIAKTEAARRQLETAVLLYFNDKDPVSIHTLTWAAHEIISRLNQKRGGAPLMLDGRMVKEEFKEEMRKRMRDAYNFFKHADRDPDRSIDFNPETNDFCLWDACEGYEMLTGEKNPYLIIYRGWFNYRYPDILNTPASHANPFGNNKIKFFTKLMATSFELSP
jgi:hypothetical protein